MLGITFNTSHRPAIVSAVDKAFPTLAYFYPFYFLFFNSVEQRCCVAAQFTTYLAILVLVASFCFGYRQLYGYVITHFPYLTNDHVLNKGRGRKIVSCSYSFILFKYYLSVWPAELHILLIIFYCTDMIWILKFQSAGGSYLLIGRLRNQPKYLTNNIHNPFA